MARTRFWTLLLALLSACATAPRVEDGLHYRAVYEGYTVAEVRGAALATLNDLSRFISPARVTEDGRVVTEHAASGWTSYEIRFEQLDGAVAAELAVGTKPQRLSCPGRSARGFRYVELRALHGPAAAAGEPWPRPTPILPRTLLDRPCEFEAREVPAGQATEILEGIRARLTADSSGPRPSGA